MPAQTPVVRHNMTSAFVTGGSGFVGQYLIEDLKAKGVKVYGLARSDRTKKLLEAKGVIVVTGDLGSVEALKKGMELCDTVFHCASTLGVVIDDFQQLFNDNVVGTRNVMQAAKESKGVKRLIYVGSTTAIFDGSDMENVDETTPYPAQPVSVYSHTKALAEEEVIKANSELLETISVRLPVVWGPQDPILPGIVKMARRGYFIYPGGGSRSATQLYVANATSGLIAAAIHGKPGEIYHLSDDRRPTFRELFRGRLVSAGCAPWQVGDAVYSRYVPGWLLWILVIISEFLWRALHLPGAPPIPREGIAIATHHFSVSDAKARSVEHLGWRPVVSHEEGAKREGQWYINNFRNNNNNNNNNNKKTS